MRCWQVRLKVRRMDLQAQKGPKMRPKVQIVDLEALIVYLTEDGYMNYDRFFGEWLAGKY